MKNLILKSFGGLIFLLIVLCVLLFLPAGTFNYWQAWVFLSFFGGSTLFVTLYLIKNDPGLLEKRVDAGPGAEKEQTQKVIQTIASIAFITIFIVSALDRRLSHLQMSAEISIFGDVLVALGLYFVFLVFKENSFTSATIEVDRKQKVISTGPYGLVRHPMYAGAFVMLIGVPLALGSLWGFTGVVVLMIAIILRLLDEEKFLNKNLYGYKEYQKKVKYRLVPLVW
jgi:protein-S-isoprenylcysteine O-methyltransferase Ste14